MKANRLQYKVAAGAMQMIANMGKLGHLALIGISQSDYDKATGATPWSTEDRNKVVQTLKALMFGATDTLGFPRFRLPAEYVAAAIVMFVHPYNSRYACLALEKSSSPADKLSKGDDSEDVSASQLFSLVVELYADPTSSSAQAQFAQKTGLALGNVLEEVEG